MKKNKKVFEIVLDILLCVAKLVLVAGLLSWFVRMIFLSYILLPSYYITMFYIICALLTVVSLTASIFKRFRVSGIIISVIAFAICWCMESYYYLHKMNSCFICDEKYYDIDNPNSIDKCNSECNFTNIYKNINPAQW